MNVIFAVLKWQKVFCFGFGHNSEPKDVKNCLVTVRILSFVYQIKRKTRLVAFFLLDTISICRKSKSDYQTHFQLTEDCTMSLLNKHCSLCHFF